MVLQHLTDILSPRRLPSTVKTKSIIWPDLAAETKKEQLKVAATAARTESVWVYEKQQSHRSIVPSSQPSAVHPNGVLSPSLSRLMNLPLLDSLPPRIPSQADFDSGTLLP